MGGLIQHFKLFNLQNGLRVIERHEQLSEEEERFVDRYFMDNVYPVLTPMALDSSRPFPLIRVPHNTERMGADNIVV